MKFQITSTYVMKIDKHNFYIKFRRMLHSESNNIYIYTTFWHWFFIIFHFRQKKSHVDERKAR